MVRVKTTSCLSDLQKEYCQKLWKFYRTVSFEYSFLDKELFEVIPRHENCYLFSLGYIITRTTQFIIWWARRKTKNWHEKASFSSFLINQKFIIPPHPHKLIISPNYRIKPCTKKISLSANRPNV